MFKLYGYSYFNDEMNLEGDNLVELLYEFWNYEMNVYIAHTNKLIFSPLQDNEFNNHLLEEFGIEIIDGEKYREFRNIKSGYIYKSPF